MAKRYAVVLAAGQGKRMSSRVPKPLMRVCGVPMITHILGALDEVSGFDRVVVVVGHVADRVEEEVERFSRGSSLEVVTVRQEQLNGTGDALAVSLSRLPEYLPGVGGSDATLLVLPADTPLLTSKTLSELVTHHESSRAAATLLTMEVDPPHGYGRIVRAKKGTPEEIVEDADADDEVAKIREVNTGVYCFDLSLVPATLRRLEPSNAQREYYLTDIVRLLANSGYSLDSLVLADPKEAWGVNDRPQLVAAEEEMRRRINAAHLRAGVMLVRPETITIDAQVNLEPGVTVWPNSQILGSSEVAHGAEIGPDTRLHDTVVGEDAVMLKVDADGANVGARSVVGPFVSIRAGAKVPPDSVVDSFTVVS